MRRTVSVLTVVAFITALLAAPVAAAPRNKNVTTIPLTCDKIDVEAVSVIQQANSSAAFDTRTGRVLVALLFAGHEVSEFTITDADDESVVLAEGTVDASFAETSGMMKGLTSRTITCAFGEEFSDTFELTEGDAAYLSEVALPDIDYTPFIGETLSVEGTFSGTVQGIVPGR